MIKPKFKVSKEILINCFICLVVTILIILTLQYILVIGFIVWLYQLRNSNKFIHPVDSYCELFGFIYGLCCINIPTTK